MGSQILLGSGAEAIATKTSAGVVKDRIAKNYRHPDIDKELRTTRTRRESKILKKLEPFGFTPKLKDTKEFSLTMEFIEGVQVKKVLDKDLSCIKYIAKNLTILHDNHIIHGDLTTSNMMLYKEKVYFIDFGLSFTSLRVEDKAVDLHLFKQALESRHHTVATKAYKEFLKYYVPKDRDEILERLRQVERRGRYKEKT